MPRDRPVSLPLFRDTIRKQRRGVAQSGSASALGAEGRGFESLRPDHKYSKFSNFLPLTSFANGDSYGSCFRLLQKYQAFSFEAPLSFCLRHRLLHTVV
jgi:hypothetical protein